MNGLVQFRSPPALLRDLNLAEIAAQGAAAQAVARINIGAASGTGDLAYSMSRSVAPELFSDGVTANRRAEATFGAAGAVGGLAISIPFECDVPTSNPANSGMLAGYAATATPPIITAGNFYAPRISTTGGLIIQQVGATAADLRTLTYANFRADYSGLKVRGMIVFGAGDSVTNPKIYVNGADITASFLLTTAGAAPNWIPATLDTTKFLSGYLWAAGRFVPHAPIVGALTAAEVLAWTESGRLPAWCMIGTGSAVAIINAATLNGGFETAGGGGADVFANWTEFFTGTGVVSDELVIVRTGAHSAKLTVDGVANIAGVTGPIGTVGRKYRLRFWARTAAGVASIVARLDSAGGTTAFNVDDTWTECVLEAVKIGPGGLQIFSAAPTANFYVDDVELIELGPLAKWEIQPVAVCYDAGANKIPLLLADGITPITTRRDWVIQAMTNTTGNQQILGGSVFVAPYDYTRHVLDDWCMNTTGTPVVTAGSVSAGANYKGSGGLTALRQMITLVTRIVATANIWVGSNTAGVIQHTIRGHLVD